MTAVPGTYGGLRGCLQNLELDGRKIGLPDVLETSGIQATCVWQYPCLAKSSPCVEGSVCFQQGTSGFKCDCDWPVCIKDQQHPGQTQAPAPPVGHALFLITLLTCEETSPRY